MRLELRGVTSAHNPPDVSRGADVTAGSQAHSAPGRRSHPLARVRQSDMNTPSNRKVIMSARMNNPAVVLPEAMGAIQQLNHTINRASSIPPRSRWFTCGRARSTAAARVSTRAPAQMRKNGETDERLFAVAAWRETPYFTEPERAALDLAEYATRLADRPDPVPDDSGRPRRNTSTRRVWPCYSSSDRHHQPVQPAQPTHRTDRRSWG